MTSLVQPRMEAVMRMPNMVATLLRDDTHHISLLLLSFSSPFFCFLYLLQQEYPSLIVIQWPREWDNVGTDILSEGLIGRRVTLSR
jgi:hypothetical protein